MINRSQDLVLTSLFNESEKLKRFQVCDSDVSEFIEQLKIVIDNCQNAIDRVLR